MLLSNLYICIVIIIIIIKRFASHVSVIHNVKNRKSGLCSGVVECMAAGTIVLAHNSGGPKLDIVVDYEGERTGFLADDVASYSAALKTIFSLNENELMRIRTNARQSVKRFADSEFEQQFLDATSNLFARFVE